MGKYMIHVVEWIAKIHNLLLRLNDKYEYNFSDKELHFLIIGAMGMFFVFMIHPIFKWLAENHHVMVITWIYVFTLMVVITFAIEIGQRVTHTGTMEFADIVFGMAGFFVMFLIFSVIRGIYHVILRAVSNSRKRKRKENHAE